MNNCAFTDTENREIGTFEATTRMTVEGTMVEATGMNVIANGIRSMHYETMPEAEAMAEAADLNRIVYAGSKRTLYYDRLSHDDAWDDAYRTMPHDIAWDMAMKEITIN